MWSVGTEVEVLPVVFQKGIDFGLCHFDPWAEEPIDRIIPTLLEPTKYYDTLFHR